MKLPEVNETVEDHGMFIGETVYCKCCPAIYTSLDLFLQNFVKGWRIKMKLPDM